MLELAKISLEWLKDRSHAGVARITASLVVPGGILALVISGVIGTSLRWDLARPLTISRLKTELSQDGKTTRKPGVAFIFEPASGDHAYNFRFSSSSPTRIWTSLEEKTTRANRERFTMDEGGMIGKTPFFEINDPVLVVVEGEMDDEILLPRSTARIEDWKLSSRRSESVVASVLLSCAVAFGISMARAFPSDDRAQQTSG